MVVRCSTIEMYPLEPIGSREILPFTYFSNTGTIVALTGTSH